MRTSLLATKFHFPPARDVLVPRPRLVERLLTGLRGPLTLISAPAGSGKTTLVSEWRDGPGAGMPVAWLSLDEADNDPARFLAYFLAALETLKPGLTGGTSGLLLGYPHPSIETILTELLNALGGFPQEFVLALDDLHVISDKTVHQVLGFLLDHQPPRLHLLFLTRSDPPLALSRLRAHGQLTEIRLEHLRFSVDEATRFLNQIMGLDLTGQQVAALERRTEGWIAGLQMAALSLQGRDLDNAGEFITAFTGNNRYILDYLVEEVLNRQTEAVQEFLMKTSILERLTGRLCDSLLGTKNSQAVLEKLEHSNMFLFPLDSESIWYRYHPLFSDILQSRLHQDDPECLNEIHCRAADWLEQNQYLAEALQHALAGGDKQHAAHLAEANDLQMLAHGELVAMLSRLKTLEELIPDYPGLCIDKAWANALTGHTDGVETLLRMAEQLILTNDKEAESRQMLGSITAIRCHLGSLKGNAQAGLDLGRQALDLLKDVDPGVRGIVQMAMGNVYLLIGDSKTAIQSLQEAGRLGQLAGNVK